MHETLPAILILLTSIALVLALFYALRLLPLPAGR
jgi:hypothetical protein